jgi:hypothetical protein
LEKEETAPINQINGIQAPKTDQNGSTRNSKKSHKRGKKFQIVGEKYLNKKIEKLTGKVGKFIDNIIPHHTSHQPITPITPLPNSFSNKIL